jgi:hypothetical protein
VYYYSHNETVVFKKISTSDADDHLRKWLHHKLHQQLCIRIRGGSCTDAHKLSKLRTTTNLAGIAESDPDMFRAELPDNKPTASAWKALGL